MIGKLLLFGLCAAVFAEESSVDIKSDLEKLKLMTEEGETKVQQVVALIADAPREYKNLTDERVGCLLWEVTAQRAETNKTITEAILKGMLKNKQFNNFQCVSKASQEVFEKLDSIEPQIPALSEKIREKALSVVRAFGLIVPGFSSYCRDLKKQKSEELNKAADQGARNKILKDVYGKMSLLETILKQVDDFVATTKYKYLEEHINYAHQTETNIRKVQREGAQKILKCVN